MVKRLKRTIALIGLVAMGAIIGGSQAHAVCTPVPPTKIGDVNGSGSIDVQDVLQIIKTAFSNGGQSRYLGSDDLDGNGVTNVQDVLREISVAFSNGSTNFSFRIYKLTGRLGTGSRQLVKDTSLQYRIYGVWGIGSDTVPGCGVDVCSSCAKTDTLLVPPGVVVQGDTSHAVPSAIVIRRTGYAVMVGTPTQQIVFTSMMPAGSRNRSDWGGMVINGCAPNNNYPSYIWNTEGGLNVGIGGGNDPHDNSGCFVYLLEQFSGREFSVDNELNGITVNSVGDGTTMDYFEVSNSADDGIEWFGGTVAVKHAVMYNYDDDGFDSDIGAQWNGQFMLSIQDETEPFSPNHEGCEWDNHPTLFDTLPRMIPTIYNMTVVGMGHCPVGAGEKKGIHIRRGSGGHVNNTIWTRFDAALDVDQAQTAAQIGTGLTINNSVWYDCGRQADDADGLEAPLVAPGPPFNNMMYLNGGCPASVALAPILMAGSFSDAGFPDFRPVVPAPVPLPVPLVPPPPFDPSGTYLGAIAPGTPPGAAWYEGWTNWAKH